MRKCIGAFIAISAFAVSAFSASCALEPPETPQFIISKPKCIVGSREGYYQKCGVEFELCNIDDREIVELTVSFIVYDRVTKKNPVIGSNQIVSSFSGSIQGHRKKDMVVSLDPYLFVAPDNPYIIDFFYVSRILYMDGTSWSDANRVYSTGSE
jgi:hypothetical protein